MSRVSSIHIAFSNRHEPTLLENCTDDKAGWTQIVCHSWHTVALTKDGKVFKWYDTRQCVQHGHGNDEKRHIRTKVKSLDGLFIVKMTCDGWHTVAITDKGDIYTWYASQKDSLT